MEISAYKPIANTLYNAKIENDQSVYKLLNSKKNSYSKEKNKAVETFNISQLLKLIKNLTPKKEINNSFISSVNVPKGVNEIAGKVINTKVSNETAKVWNELVGIAIESNKGAGSPDSGYLAFSEEHGFINYLNPEISIEENKALASKSLEAQISIESIEREIGNNIITLPNLETQNPEIKNEDKGFFDKVKDIFSFVSKGIKKVREITKSASKIGDKVGDFAEHLKTSDYSFVRKIGGYIDQGLSYLSKLFG